MKRPYQNPDNDPYTVQFYEGLVRRTAAKFGDRIEEEYEDLLSILRIKCWRALESYDSTRSKMPVERYVFSCLYNQVKDLLKRQRRNHLYIEDVAPSTAAKARRDAFDARYLCVDEDEVFAEVVEGTPLIPSTLSPAERRVIVYLYLEYTQADIALALNLTKREVAKTVKSIRQKMADWRPSGKAPMPTDRGGHVEAAGV